MKKGNIDWNAVAEKAQAMTICQLTGAIQDIRATLQDADDLDRTDEGDRGGYYRDEASIYHAEIARREAAGDVIDSDELVRIEAMRDCDQVDRHLTAMFQRGSRADELTTRLSAFNSFRELIEETHSGYRPTLKGTGDSVELANLYDFAMELRGDSRRAFRGIQVQDSHQGKVTAEDVDFVIEQAKTAEVCTYSPSLEDLGVQTPDELMEQVRTDIADAEGHHVDILELAEKILAADTPQAAAILAGQIAALVMND
ncbi:MAG: hypothetical protein V3S82_10245 [Dehalococcoidia bacterium]